MGNEFASIRPFTRFGNGTHHRIPPTILLYLRWDEIDRLNSASYP
jgi:hypothetical protein